MCDTSLDLCVPLGCLAQGAACTSSSDCCSGTCAGGACK
jgi:hypothetical protein